MRTHRLALVAWSALFLLLLGAGGASASVATVVENDYFFSPSSVTVTGPSTVVLNNASSTPHTFTVSGQGIDVVSNGGQSGSVTINLPPGTYSFICRFHASLGMTGSLVVRAAAPGATPVGGPETGAGGTSTHRPFPFLPVLIGSVLLVAGLLAMRGRRA
ncbi:MAG: cupredoxin domain-containing protein [Gaiellaceae bacterium]